MNDNINLYESLANQIDGMIKTSVFRPGERLPSVRHLANQNQISVSTVTQAMRLLQDRGLVDVKPQAGYYVRHRPRPIVNDVNDRDFKTPTYVDVSNGYTKILQANSQENMVQFGAAWMPDDLIPIKRLQSMVAGVVRAHPEIFNSPGFFNLNDPGFVRQIVRRAASWGKIDPTEIIITSTGTEAMSLCLRSVAKPGDTIAIESPCHILKLQLIQSLGMKALEIPTHSKTGISLEALELALSGNMVQACLFMPNASNPLGCVMPDANKKRLVQLLDQYQVPLIENDLYGDLCFAIERPLPVKAFDTSGNVLLVSSFSKVVTSALSAGYIMAGKRAHQMIYSKALASGPASHFNQAVLAAMINGSQYNNHLRHVRRTMAQRIAQVSDAVSRYFPASCSISEPQGGFVIWVQLPQQVNAYAVHAEALKQKIAFMPGGLFSPSGKFNNYMRINCGNPWDARIEHAIERIGIITHEVAERAG
jgi:DNA-binding transcriptional MocR family regulator